MQQDEHMYILPRGHSVPHHLHPRWHVLQREPSAAERKDRKVDHHLPSPLPSGTVPAVSRIATIVVVVVLAVHSSIHVQPKLPKCNLASFNEGDVVTKLKKDTVCITNRSGTKCCVLIDYD